MKDPRIGWLVAGTVGVLAVVLVVLLLTRDDPGPVAGTTTTADLSTTTTTPPSSTTTPEPTTTAAPTSTVDTTSTTTTVPDADWASVPLVVAPFGALGWWDGSGWVQVETGTDLPVEGGESYAVAALEFTGTTTGGPPTVLCEPLGNPGVELADAEAVGTWPGPVGVAVSADWDLVPNTFEPATDDGTYASFASELLAVRGLDVADPVISQLFRVDLEGDGVDEALVVARDIESDGLLGQPGDYSIVFVRKLVDTAVQTAVLAESIVDEVAEGETPFVEAHAIGAVADLSGDGVMEIVVSSAYYEGLGVGVWEWVDDDLGLVYRIGSGCGA